GRGRQGRPAVRAPVLLVGLRPAGRPRLSREAPTAGGRGGGWLRCEGGRRFPFDLGRLPRWHVLALTGARGRGGSAFRCVLGTPGPSTARSCILPGRSRSG